MKAFKGTKGNFKDGTTSWKVGERETNGTKGWEIHWSDDEECVTDHVYELEDAKLIAAAPKLLKALQRWVKFAEQQNLDYESSMVRESKEAINKALD